MADTAHSTPRGLECWGCAQKARLPEHRVRRVEARSDSRPMLARCLGTNAGLCVLLAHDFLGVSRGGIGCNADIIFQIEPRRLVG